MIDQELPLTNTEKIAVFDKADAAGPQKTVDILVDAGVINTIPWWQSKAIWGALVTVAASFAGLAGYAVDIGVTTELVVSLVTLVGGALGWWGRVKAVQPISRTQVAPGITLESKQ